MSTFEELLELNGIKKEDAVKDPETEQAEALADIWEAICNIELFGLEMEE